MQPPGNRIPVNIEDEMRNSYLDYAMSVIRGRALPDVRDGLKPVHRRILYTMYEQRNFFTSSYKKSARIVGDVLGKYHPHGDTAVYDALVRMAQDFAMRYPLVDGQGNFGSVDGDRAAAMRYTEVRMTRLAGELLADIEKRTVDFQDNYDGSEQEPTVLPAAYPNLLVNGSNGIAVGMATNMPPHNLTEVINGTIAVIDNPDIELVDLMQHIPGPDFPTGGYIYGRAGIFKAYETGRGVIKMRAKTHFEYDDNGDETALIVTEIPYQVNKARLLQRIAELVRDKKIDGIRALRDESDRRGMRIFIGLKRGALGQIVLNKLFSMTPMQQSFGINNLAIVGGQPRMLGLKDLLVHFVNHRRDVVTRRTRYDLRKAEERAHILEGYLIALDNIDEVVELIKASPTPAEARVALQNRFEFTEVQAQSILDMRLQRLTGLEVDKIKAEYEELQTLIEELRSILASDEKLMNLIVEELTAIRDKYADERRTLLVDASGEIGMEDLIANEDMVITITTTGYIKRTPLSEYRSQARGGKGRSGMSTKEQDEVTNLFVASAHTLLMIFTDRGQVYPLKVWEVPKSGINGRGKAIINLIPIQQGESIRSIVPIEDLDDADKHLLFATRNGTVKRTVLNLYKNVRSNGIRAIILVEGDDLVRVKLAEPGDHIMLVTAKGQSIIFSQDGVRATGRASKGVIGIKFRGDDKVADMDVIKLDGLPSDEDEGEGDEEESSEAADLDAMDAEAGETEEEDVNVPSVVLVTEKGYGKRTPLNKFRIQKRAGLGLRALPYVDRNGPLVAMCQVRLKDDLMVVTDGGTIIRTPVAEIRAYSRSAKGVRVIRMAEEESVSSIYTVSAADDEEEVVEAAAEGAEVEGSGAAADGGATADDTPVADTDAADAGDAEA